jgi:hypothetical protein
MQKDTLKDTLLCLFYLPFKSDFDRGVLKK